MCVHNDINVNTKHKPDSVDKKLNNTQICILITIK